MEIEITTQDVIEVGEHYWGGDYEPSYLELNRLAKIWEDKINEKIKNLSLKNA